MSSIRLKNGLTSPKKWIVQGPGSVEIPGSMDISVKIKTGALSAKSEAPAVIRKGVTS